MVKGNPIYRPSYIYPDKRKPSVRKDFENNVLTLSVKAAEFGGTIRKRI